MAGPLGGGREAEVKGVLRRGLGYSHLLQRRSSHLEERNVFMPTQQKKNAESMLETKRETPSMLVVGDLRVYLYFAPLLICTYTVIRSSASKMNNIMLTTALPGKYSN